MATEADGGRLPAVEAQGGQAVAGRARLGDGLIHRHVGCAGAGLLLDKSGAMCDGSKLMSGRAGLTRPEGSRRFHVVTSSRTYGYEQCACAGVVRALDDGQRDVTGRGSG